MADPRFRVLVVCTGNICRSPMAERLLAAGLRRHFGDEADDVVVTSAGTWGHEGAPMEPYAAQALLELDADPAGFRARELVATMVTEADLVLTATRDHRAAVVTMVPRAAARTFTLPEFARLATAVDVELPQPLVARFAALVPAAAAKRGLVRPKRADDDDVKDPYGATPDIFRTCAAAVAAPVDQIVAALARA